MVGARGAGVKGGAALLAPTAAEIPSFLYPTPTASRTSPLGKVATPPLALAPTLRIVPRSCSLAASVVEGLVKKLTLDFVPSSAASAPRVAFQSPTKLNFTPAPAATLRVLGGVSPGSR